MRTHILILLLVSFSVKTFAEIDTTAVKSIEGITNKMLELISGDIGETRNWDKFRNLFLPTAQTMIVNQKASPSKQVKTINLEEFVRYIGPSYKRDGFKEIAIGLTVNEFNGIANVFQSYHCKNLTGTYEKRGINSYQLVYANGRWWIASTTFTNETDENKIPDNYLFEEYKSKN